MCDVIVVRMSGEISRLKRELFSLQTDSGAFESIVHKGGASLLDCNGVTTALVLREMESFADPDCEEPINRALDFLEACESSSGSGMFSFWPPRSVPSWAPYNPDECDSTAIIATELFHFGRITPERACFMALDVMPEFQTSTGEFLAWRSQSIVPNPVDIVLNVNVIAYIAQTGSCGSTVYRNACRAVCQSVTACEGNADCLDRLMPYYPEPAELFSALTHALRRGACELVSVARELESFPVAVAAQGSNILFANEGRRTTWSSEAVRTARQITQQMGL